MKKAIFEKGYLAAERDAQCVIPEMPGNGFQKEERGIFYSLLFFIFFHERKTKLIMEEKICASQKKILFSLRKKSGDLLAADIA